MPRTHTPASDRRRASHLLKAWLVFALFNAAPLAGQIWQNPSNLPTSGGTTPDVADFHGIQRYALRAIHVEEDLDRPYLITLTFEPFNEGDPAQAQLVAGDDPGSSTGRNVIDDVVDFLGLVTFYTTAGFGGSGFSAMDHVRGVATGGADEFIHAIRVCTNGSERRIKGIRIWSARIERDGDGWSTVPTENRRQFQRANCSTWHDKQECPPGQLVVGLKGYWDGRSFRGLSIRCAEVVSQSVEINMVGSVGPSTDLGRFTMDVFSDGSSGTGPPLATTVAYFSVRGNGAEIFSAGHVSGIIPPAFQVVSEFFDDRVQSLGDTERVRLNLQPDGTWRGTIRGENDQIYRVRLHPDPEPEEM